MTKRILLPLLVLVVALPVLAPSSALAEPAECGDAIDNDADGLTDYPDDPGCLEPTDDTERDPAPQCSDGLDNDGDGATDFPDDTNCDSGDDDAEAPRCGEQQATGAYSASSGCFSRTVTIRFDRDLQAFTGVVVSQRQECWRRAEIVLRQRRPGPNPALGSVLTNRRGRWRLPMGGPVRGRFYAEVEPQDVTTRSGVPLYCPGDRSVTITVRRRG